MFTCEQFAISHQTKRQTLGEIVDCRCKAKRGGFSLTSRLSNQLAANKTMITLFQLPGHKALKRRFVLQVLSDRRRSTGDSSTDLAPPVSCKSAGERIY